MRQKCSVELITFKSCAKASVSSTFATAIENTCTMGVRGVRRPARSNERCGGGAAAGAQTGADARTNPVEHGPRGRGGEPDPRQRSGESHLISLPRRRSCALGSGARVSSRLRERGGGSSGYG